MPDPFAEFAARFAEAWSAPTPERLTALLTDDVVLEQPMAPTARGKEQAKATLGRLIELIPDIHAEVHSSWGDAGGGAITFDLSARSAAASCAGISSTSSSSATGSARSGPATSTRRR